MNEIFISHKVRLKGLLEVILVVFDIMLNMIIFGK